jgi:eukaryotic-like serine/threonine-protein kinase
MQPGTTLVNKYRLEKLLGRGGMGSVWRAEHLGFRAPVALKLMEREVALDPESLARFHREAHAAASIRSPNVVQVLDHGVDEDTNTPFIVMELLEGETLGERLAREKTLSPAKTASVIGDVCRALGRAHPAGIVHRDLKPDNVFLVRDDPEFAKVLDFGVAKSRAYLLGENDTTTRTGSLVGTPYYMSPEQISGSKQLDARSDLWSVAVMACECLTGRRPFEANSVGGLAVAICTRPIPRASELGTATPELDAWLERALERDPALRFQSARELAEALTACTVARAQTPPVAPAPPSEAPASSSDALAGTLGSQTAPVPPRRRSQRLRVAIVALALSSVLAALWWSSSERPPTTTAAPAPPPAPLPERSAEITEQHSLAVEPGAQPAPAPVVAVEPSAPQAPAPVVAAQPAAPEPSAAPTAPERQRVNGAGKRTPTKSARVSPAAVARPVAAKPSAPAVVPAPAAAPEPEKPRPRRESLGELLEDGR